MQASIRGEWFQQRELSSVVLLRIGHGCVAPDGVTKVATHAVSAVIPAALLANPASAAMQIPGFDAIVAFHRQKQTRAGKLQ
jgi:hypothetical protein